MILPFLLSVSCLIVKLDPLPSSITDVSLVRLLHLTTVADKTVVKVPIRSTILVMQTYPPILGEKVKVERSMGTSLYFGKLLFACELKKGGTEGDVVVSPLKGCRVWIPHQYKRK